MSDLFPAILSTEKREAPKQVVQQVVSHSPHAWMRR